MKILGFLFDSKLLYNSHSSDFWADLGLFVFLLFWHVVILHSISSIFMLNYHRPAFPVCFEVVWDFTFLAPGKKWKNKKNKKYDSMTLSYAKAVIPVNLGLICFLKHFSEKAKQKNKQKKVLYNFFFFNIFRRVEILHSFTFLPFALPYFMQSIMASFFFICWLHCSDKC